MTAGEGANVEIHLSEGEARELAGILESYLSDLRMEIADTDSHDFRETLKERKAFLEDLLERLG